MVTLKTEHGEFTAETVREAQKEARKAEKLAVKQEAEREAILQVARDRAKAAGYWMLARKAHGDDFPESYHYSQTPNYSCMLADPASCALLLSVADQYGAGELSFLFGWRYAGHVESVSGYCVCLFLQNTSGPADPLSAMAIGTNAGIAAYVDLPGITIADFKPA